MIRRTSGISNRSLVQERVMGKKFPSNLGIATVLVVLTSLVLLSPVNLLGGSGMRMITLSGKRVMNVFEGLSPNIAVPRRNGTLGNSLPRSRPWRGKLTDDRVGKQWSSQQNRPWRFLEVCETCFFGPCFGQYMRTVTCHGCCTNWQVCQPISNYESDPDHEPPSSQVRDEPCGPDCCDDFATDCG